MQDDAFKVEGRNICILDLKEISEILKEDYGDISS